jgi:hypothetical protein
LRGTGILWNGEHENQNQNRMESNEMGGWKNELEKTSAKKK